MATLKHINSKNADYGAAEQYLLFEHDEFTMKPTLDECSCTVEKHKTWIASPATIPKSGERNRKIHSCMLYLISI